MIAVATACALLCLDAALVFAGVILARVAHTATDPDETKGAIILLGVVVLAAVAVAYVLARGAGWVS